MSLDLLHRPQISPREELQHAISLSYPDTDSALPLKLRLPDGFCVQDGASLRTIEGRRKLGQNRYQLAIRTSQETVPIAICHLVAASSFTADFDAYRKRTDHRVFKKVSVQKQETSSRSCTMISIQRHKATKHIHLPTILISSIDRSNQISYYTRSGLVKKWGKGNNFDARLIDLLHGRSYAGVTEVLDHIVPAESQPSLDGTQSSAKEQGDDGPDRESTPTIAHNYDRGDKSYEQESPATSVGIEAGGVTFNTLPHEILMMILEKLFGLPTPFFPVEIAHSEGVAYKTVSKDQPMMERWIATQEQYRQAVVVNRLWHKTIVRNFRRSRIDDPLILASAVGLEEKVKELLENPGIDINRGLQMGYRGFVRRDETDNPSRPAAIWLELLKDISLIRAREGQTALMTAAAMGHHRIVKLLLADGRTKNRVNQLDSRGCSALTYARNGSFATRHYLKEAGAEDPMRLKRDMLRNIDRSYIVSGRVSLTDFQD